LRRFVKQQDGGHWTCADEQGMDSYIRQLTKMDPDSCSSRFWSSKEGTPLLPNDLKFINLEHFAEMVERLADYLDGLDMALSVFEERKDEMASYGSYA
jgi:hypothetical protein